MRTVNIENITKIIEFIQNETPENEEMLEKTIMTVDAMLQSELNIVNQYIKNLAEQMDYDKIQKYAEMAQIISSITVSMKVIFDKIKIEKNNSCKDIFEEEFVEDNMDFIIDDQKRINYEKYRIDETIPYALTTDFRYTKPAAFSLDGIRYPARMWKQLLVTTCELLNKKSNKIFEEFLEDKFMQGKTRKYFSKNEKELWNPEEIKGTDIFIETNLCANDIRNMVLKMLDKYRIPYADFEVYLSKDLRPLHKEEIKENLVIEQVPQEEVLDMKQLCNDYDYKTGHCINEESPYFTMECCHKKNCRYIRANEKIYVYPKEVLRKDGCPICGGSLTYEKKSIQYENGKEIKKINLNATVCQRCNKIYITEGTYNAFISNKNQNKLEAEFVLDFYR